MEDNKKKAFQTGLLIVFGFAIVIAVAMFSLSKAGNNTAGATVVLWGTFPRTALAEPIGALNDTSEDTGVTIEYVQKDASSYNAELVEAFASGVGPDLFLITQDMIIPYKNKITSLPYTSFPERDFRIRYSDGASVFLAPDGIVAFPLAVDPLMMYYNKSMFNSAGIATPPTQWSQFAGLVPELTQLDSNRNILKSGLAFGQFNNIQYASNIFETLLLQLGNPIITQDSAGNYVSVVNSSNSGSSNPLYLSLQFFTNFANPLLDTYSWNSVQSTAEDMFVQDRLAIYFAPASRFFDIQRKNINLNYDMTKIPQVSDTANFVTSGDFYGIAVAKSSRNQSPAFTAANLLSNGVANPAILENTSLAPVRRDLLAQTAGLTSYESAVRDSALISYTWKNPAPGTTEGYFRQAVDNVITGALDASAAANRVHNELTLLLNSYNK